MSYIPLQISRVKLGMSDVDPKLDSPPQGVTKPGFHYSDVHLIARIAKSSGTGNCGENAALTAIMLADKGVSPVENFIKPGHMFTVIGREPGSDPADPSTWGPNAVIVDGWDRKSYPANQISKEMFGGATPYGLEKMYDVAK